MIKTLLKYPIKLFLKIIVTFWYKKYLLNATNPLSNIALFKIGLYQKVLRINSNVYWPVHKTSTISVPNNINPGTRTPALSKGCHLDGRNGIIFGKNVWIGPYASIISQNHNINNYTEYINSQPIIIGDNCWIAAHSLIMPGVQLGNHIVVAAGSVVTKSFLEDDILIGGVPAKKIKKLNKYKG